MKRPNTAAVLFLSAIIVLSLSAALTAQEQKETVKIGGNAALGKFLTSSDGRTLYAFKKDSPGKSACSGPCTVTWEVYCYNTDQINVGKGLNKSDFSSFYRKDNDQDHLTYKGMPLYTYSGDSKPGDTNGQGIESAWFVVRP